jgi:outer membrane receptor for ferric coprogen and ferric-rhodotorulic acid
MGEYALTERASVRLNVYNLFDETCYTNRSWFAGFVCGKPRNARVTLEYDF